MRPGGGVGGGGEEKCGFSASISVPNLALPRRTQTPRPSITRSGGRRPLLPPRAARGRTAVSFRPCCRAWRRGGFAILRAGDQQQRQTSRAGGQRWRRDRFFEVKVEKTFGRQGSVRSWQAVGWTGPVGCVGRSRICRWMVLKLLAVAWPPIVAPGFEPAAILLAFRLWGPGNRGKTWPGDRS